MKNLLHERLREYSIKSAREHIYPSTLMMDAEMEYCSRESEQKMFSMFADEIERYYIPRPRFEDGEPVQFDEDVLLEDGTTCPVTTLGMSLSGTLIVNPYSKDEGCIIELKEGETVERPQPKVLDADGVEINVGDTMWVIGGADDGKKLTVKGFEHCDSGEVYVSCGEKSFVNILRCPSDLTHKEPDSLQKVYASICDEVARRAMNDTTKTMCEWADRLSALIERGA